VRRAHVAGQADTPVIARHLRGFDQRHLKAESIVKAETAEPTLGAETTVGASTRDICVCVVALGVLLQCCYSVCVCVCVCARPGTSVFALSQCVCCHSVVAVCVYVCVFMCVCGVGNGIYRYISFSPKSRVTLCICITYSPSGGRQVCAL
jgi:hypothetical protein